MVENENQRLIIEADDKPLLVVAGPGAGKTFVLEQRVRRLLTGAPRSHYRILAITFTNVAAANLSRRIDDLQSQFEDRLEIGTFHAFAARVLQQHGSHIGLSPDFSIISAVEDRTALADEALRLIGVDVEGRRLLPLLARLYERGASAESVGTLVDSAELEPYLPDLLKLYRDISVQRGQIDFSLLVYLTLELLTRFPSIAGVLRKIYRYICVDEFQDTNDAQFRLLELLSCGDAKGLLFLADQDQVIYQWNGASPARLRHAQQRFEMNVAILPTSFRCPSAILDAANLLISHNLQRFVAPHFNTQRQVTGEIEVFQFPTEAEEANWIAARLLEEGDPNEVVVLGRNRASLERIEAASSRLGAPAAIPVTRYEFEAAPLRMLHSMLRLANIGENRKFVERLTSAFFEMTGRQVDPGDLIAVATANEQTPLEVFFAQLRPTAATPEFAALADVIEAELIARRQFRNVSSVFFRWINRLSDFASWAQTAYLASYEEERELWLQFERAHRGLVSDKVTLGEFLRALDLQSKTPVRQDVVRLLTVHSAKGLEFDKVYIVGATDGQFPAFQAVKLGASSEPMEEERRSFFVAMTRSKQSVTITHAQRVRGFNAARSRFINEMGLA